MGYTTRKESFQAGTAVPNGAAAQSDNPAPAVRPRDGPPRPDAMGYTTRKEDFLDETAVPKGAAAHVDNPAARPRDGPPVLADGDRLLIGHRRMSEYAVSMGFPVSKSTLQKRCSPAINTGPRIVAYFGQRPATTEMIMRQWLQANLRPVATERPRDAVRGELPASIAT